MKPQFSLREGFNAISDVVNNRPRPLRKFDQIFMKSADMLLQTEHVSKKLANRSMVCIGDGDAIGLCLIHLHNQKILTTGPKSLCVLDFDERVINSVLKFAETYRLEEKITAELYNVANPLPEKHWQKYDGFYTNPPFGKSNDGKSVKAFVKRGIEAIGNSGIGCIVVADDQTQQWSQSVLRNVQEDIINQGLFISEMWPAFHKYHLDDVPDLTSCSMIVQKFSVLSKKYNSKQLPEDVLKNFYGNSQPLEVKYVRDLTEGNYSKSKDYKFDYINGD